MALLNFNDGNIPVTLTSMHGGSFAPPLVHARTCKGVPASCDCTILKDMYTKEITERIISTMKTIYGTPYSAISGIHRRYIDFNRSKPCAYEDIHAEKYYDEMYNKIKEFTKKTSYLFDIHGTPFKEYNVYIGTLNGNSIKHLLSIDKNALDRLRTLFTNAGYTVQPSRSGEKEILSGENILKTFGSYNIGGIDSFQIEISASIRDDYTVRTTFADNLSRIIKTFVLNQNEYTKAKCPNCNSDKIELLMDIKLPRYIARCLDCGEMFRTVS